MKKVIIIGTLIIFSIFVAAAIPYETCDLEEVIIDVDIYETQEKCGDKYDIPIDCSDPKAKLNDTDGLCYTKTQNCWIEKVKIKTEKQLIVQCKQDTIKIKYKDKSLYKEKLDIECTSSSQLMICDSKQDGNGDGICQSGETCHTFLIVDTIQYLFTLNSEHDETKRYKNGIKENIK